MALTINSSLYQGRKFSPVLDFKVSGNQGPIQADVGHDGCACVEFVAKGTVTVAIHPSPTPANQSQQRIISISKNKADFSSGARTGYDCAIQGRVGAKPGPLQTYVSLVDGETYYINVANARPDEPLGGNMEITLTFGP